MKSLRFVMQVAAMKREVRPLVARSKAPRLAIDELAVAREKSIVLRCASRSNECVLKAERAQLLDRVRSQIDADAESMQVGSGLEDSDALRRFRGVNGKRQRQSADAPADDDEIHSLRDHRGISPKRIRPGCEIWPHRA
jgi:hypothetical protein